MGGKIHIIRSTYQKFQSKNAANYEIILKALQMFKKLIKYKLFYKVLY